MRSDQQILDDSTADQVFLNDPLERGRVAFTVPRAFRIDDRDGASFTDAKAIGLGAQDAPLIGEAQLGKPPLQELPRRNTAFHVAALRFGLLGAQEDVTARNR